MLKLPVDPIAVVAAGIAAIALFVAWHQLREMALQTRANILLAFDERWESELRLSARTEFTNLVDTITAEAKGKQPQLKDQVLDAELSVLLDEKLKEMRTANKDRYLKILLLCGFFETVGHATRVKYVRVDDVVPLLGVSIAEVGAAFELHIIRLQSELGGDARQYENFQWLVRCERATGPKYRIR